MSWRNKMGDNQEANQILQIHYRKQFLQAVHERRLSDAIAYFTQLKQVSLEEMLLEEAIYNMAGLCYYQMGIWQEARACFLLSHKLNDSEENKASNYLKVLTTEEIERFKQMRNQVLEAMTIKDYKKAAKLLRQSKEIEETVQGDLLLGLCQYARKRKESALICFKNALEKDASNHTAIHLIRSLQIKDKGIGYLLWKTIMNY